MTTVFKLNHLKTEIEYHKNRDQQNVPQFI